MRTWEVHTDDGRVCGFEIGNTFTWRGGVLRILRSIPGVEITKTPKFFSGNDDEFIHFNYCGQKFYVEELFGDNSRYWIRAKDELGFPYVSEIRARFRRRRPWAII